MASGASSSSTPTAGSCVHKRVSADNAGGAASVCLHKRVSSRELSGTTKGLGLGLLIASIVLIARGAGGRKE